MAVEVPVLAALVVTLLSWQAPATAADDLAPIMRAAARGDLAAVTTLVGQGVDVNATHAVLRLSPLMFAAYGGHGAVVAFLLEKGASANLKDASGASAADWASQGGHQAIATTLTKAGAQLNPFLNVGVLPFALMDAAVAKPPGR